jgi:hypothetical protein
MASNDAQYLSGKQLSGTLTSGQSWIYNGTVMIPQSIGQSYGVIDVVSYDGGPTEQLDASGAGDKLTLSGASGIVLSGAKGATYGADAVTFFVSGLTSGQIPSWTEISGKAQSGLNMASGASGNATSAGAVASGASGIATGGSGIAVGASGNATTAGTVASGGSGIATGGSGIAAGASGIAVGGSGMGQYASGIWDDAYGQSGFVLISGAGLIVWSDTMSSGKVMKLSGNNIFTAYWADDLTGSGGSGNAFQNINVHGTNLDADTSTDTLNVSGRSGVLLTGISGADDTIFFEVSGLVTGQIPGLVQLQNAVVNLAWDTYTSGQTFANLHTDGFDDETAINSGASTYTFSSGYVACIAKASGLQTTRVMSGDSYIVRRNLQGNALYWHWQTSGTGYVRGWFSSDAPGTTKVSVGPSGTETAVASGTVVATAASSGVIVHISGDGTTNSYVEISGGLVSGVAVTGIYGPFVSGNNAVLASAVSGTNTTAYNRGPLVEGGNFSGYSVRAIITSGNISGYGDQVRVFLGSISSGSVKFAHTAIGARAQSGDTTATPTVVTWSNGQSGVTIAANTQSGSDWIDFPIAAATDYIVIMDFAADAVYGHRWYSGAGSDGFFMKAATTSYNTQNITEGDWTSGSSGQCEGLQVRWKATPNLIHAFHFGSSLQINTSGWENIDKSGATSGAVWASGTWPAGTATYFAWSVNSGNASEVWKSYISSAMIDIARLSGSTWQYYSGGSTWVNAAGLTDNSRIGALTAAFRQSQNQMNHSGLSGVPDSAWSGIFQAGTLDFAVGLSPSGHAVPAITSITVEYMQSGQNLTLVLNSWQPSTSGADNAFVLLDMTSGSSGAYAPGTDFRVWQSINSGVTYAEVSGFTSQWTDGTHTFYRADKSGLTPASGQYAITVVSGYNTNNFQVHGIGVGLSWE